MKIHNLISTVGTSLFTNLFKLREKVEKNIENITSDEKTLDEHYRNENWTGIGKTLQNFSSSERICGAEINSITSMTDLGYVPEKCDLFFCHSATDDGRAIGKILKIYYEDRGHNVKPIEICDLQDENPRRFRTYGLRNLAKEICKVIRNYSSSTCAINATGGYKAQIAIAVLLGQAIGVPVYYKHERFNEVIKFPPMPVSLDFEVWMKASGMLFNLEEDAIRKSEYSEDWEENFESLVETVDIDGEDYIELSPTGQIFHETFNERFRQNQENLLPPASKHKEDPSWEDSGHMKSHREIFKFMDKITKEIPQVKKCYTFYYNPKLSCKNRFRTGVKGIEAHFSNGTYTVKIGVDTTCKTSSEFSAMSAYLNRWLAGF